MGSRCRDPRRLSDYSSTGASVHYSYLNLINPCEEPASATSPVKTI